jgi:hypothetical protein
MQPLETLYELVQGLGREVASLARQLRELALELRRHDHRGVNSVNLSLETRDIALSFETNEQTATKLYFPYGVRVLKIRGIVMKAIAGTDNGTITGANADGNSSGGVITATASDALNTEYSVTPTTNNTVAKDSFYKLTSAKTTAGGKVLVTLEYERLPTI